MTADDLLELAEDLVRRDPGRPRQASLKRAVSTAYYALFHALADECVDQTVGWGFRSDQYWQTVTPLYRAMDHASAKRLFEQLRNSAQTSAELKQVGRAFVELQAERIRADYDPKPIFARRDAVELIGQARNAVSQLRGLAPDVKRHLAAQLVTKQR